MMSLPEAPVLSNQKQPHQSQPWIRSETFIAWCFILPSLIGITVFVFILAVRGLLLSFTNSDLLTRADFIGLENYQKLIDDKQFWSSLSITMKYVLLTLRAMVAAQGCVPSVSKSSTPVIVCVFQLLALKVKVAGVTT